jgi:hypothetical protein
MFGDEGEDVLTHVGASALSVQLAEHDLNLVEPGGIDGQPMKVDGKRLAEAREPGRQAPRRMRGAVVQDQVKATNVSTPDTSESLRMKL